MPQKDDYWRTTFDPIARSDMSNKIILGLGTDKQIENEQELREWFHQCRVEPQKLPPGPYKKDLSVGNLFGNEIVLLGCWILSIEAGNVTLVFDRIVAKDFRK